MAAEGDGAPSREDGYGTSFEVPMPERRPLPTGMSLATYAGEQDLPPLVDLFEADLSEPYSVFTYRYFVNTWPDLCLIVRGARAREARDSCAHPFVPPPAREKAQSRTSRPDSC